MKDSWVTSSASSVRFGTANTCFGSSPPNTRHYLKVSTDIRVRLGNRILSCLQDAQARVLLACFDFRKVAAITPSISAISTCVQPRTLADGFNLSLSQLLRAL